MDELLFNVAVREAVGRVDGKLTGELRILTVVSYDTTAIVRAAFSPAMDRYTLDAADLASVAAAFKERAP